MAASDSDDTELADLLAQVEAQEKASAPTKEQTRADEIAVAKAKLEHGSHNVSVIRLSRTAPGLPTLVVCKTPDRLAHRRFRDVLLRDEKKRALDFMASDARVYPDDATFVRMCGVFPELSDQVAAVGIALAKGGAVIEGKE